MTHELGPDTGKTARSGKPKSAGNAGRHGQRKRRKTTSEMNATPQAMGSRGRTEVLATKADSDQEGSSQGSNDLPDRFPLGRCIDILDHELGGLDVLGADKYGKALKSFLVEDSRKLFLLVGDKTIRRIWLDRL